MNTLVTMLKALGHQTRLRLLNLLSRQSLCVCELRNILDLSQSNTSRHLGKLKQSELIYGTKDAQWVYYALNEEIVNEYPFLEKLLERELVEKELFQADVEKLNTYRQSETECENLDEANIF